MRKLWEDHVVWTRLYIVSAIARLPDTSATAARLLQHQTDMGDAIKPFYGDAAGERLTALLKPHILIAAELVTAARNGKTADIQSTSARWYANANEIADFLSAANPRAWPRDTMRREMKHHLDLTLQEAQARLRGDWAADIAAYDAIHQHILGMAHVLSGGIMSQFAQRFNTNQAAAGDLTMPHYPYLLIGAGMTADAAARGIREVDPDGKIGIIGAERDAPYARPPLSKALWKGEPLESVWRNTAETGADLHLGRRAVSLDPVAKRVIDDRGAELTFDTLLLATGGTPRRLALGGDQLIYYRTLEDYRRLRALADQGKNVAVIGGGFIGSEVAAALAMQGCRVTMLFPEDGIGARVFPADLARTLIDYYREKGVDVRPGERVTDLREEGSQTTVAAASGFRLTVDAVVAGIGIAPNVELAQAAGLAVEDGIVVDQHLTTTRPGIFAAGDVARFTSPQLGIRMRVEHEDNALSMGRAAGRAMAGDRAEYAHLPFFYSDLFERGYEAVGQLDPRGEVVADWKEEYLEGVVYYLSGGRVRGVLLWNTWGQVDAARELIAQPGPFSARDLKGRLPA